VTTEVRYTFRSSRKQHIYQGRSSVIVVKGEHDQVKNRCGIYSELGYCERVVEEFGGEARLLASAAASWHVVSGRDSCLWCTVLYSSASKALLCALAVCKQTRARNAHSAHPQ